MTPADAIPSTRALLVALAEGGPPDEHLSFHRLLGELGRRAFGMLILLATLPAFLPLPVGAGAVSGPLASLLGLQLLLLMRQPWLPGFIGRRGMTRASLARFERRIGRVLGWVERMVKPRGGRMFERGAALAFTGAQLVVVGFLLSLPIPLTNYPLAMLIVFYALALLARDGLMLGIVWVLGLATIVAAAVLSGTVAEAVQASWVAVTQWFAGVGGGTGAAG